MYKKQCQKNETANNKGNKRATLVDNGGEKELYKKSDQD